MQYTDKIYYHIIFLNRNNFESDGIAFFWKSSSYFLAVLSRSYTIKLIPSVSEILNIVIYYRLFKIIVLLILISGACFDKLGYDIDYNLY